MGILFFYHRPSTYIGQDSALRAKCSLSNTSSLFAVHFGLFWFFIFRFGKNQHCQAEFKTNEIRFGIAI